MLVNRLPCPSCTPWWSKLAFHFRMACSNPAGQVSSACTPRWQPCVRAQATLYKKKHYLPVMKATNSDSKRCQVSVDVSFQSPSFFQRKKARTLSSQAKRGRPHRLLLGGVQSKQRRNHFCGGNVLMYAANFQYLIVPTADHGKNANWCTRCPCVCATSAGSHAKAPTNQFPQAAGSCDAVFFRISMSYLRTSLGYSVRWPAAKQAAGVIAAVKKFRRKPSGMFLSQNIQLCTNHARAAICKWCSTSKVGPCTFFVVRKQPNHLWPQSRGNTDTSAPFCKRKLVGGCASVVKTKIFDAFKTNPTSCNAPISSSNIKINSSFETVKGVNRLQNEDPKVVPCHPRNLIHNAQLSHAMSAEPLQHASKKTWAQYAPLSHTLPNVKGTACTRRTPHCTNLIVVKALENPNHVVWDFVLAECLPQRSPMHAVESRW